jgi:hypothetical protein
MLTLFSKLNSCWLTMLITGRFTILASCSSPTAAPATLADVASLQPLQHSYKQAIMHD